MKVLVCIAALVVIVVGSWIGLHAWYVQTHCTMVLGTQVCAAPEQSSSAAPPPTPTPTVVPSATAATAGYVIRIRPGVWEIDCASGVVQCVPPGRVGAGPGDSTCHFETINGAVSTVWERCRA